MAGWMTSIRMESVCAKGSLSWWWRWWWWCKCANVRSWISLHVGSSFENFSNKNKNRTKWHKVDQQPLHQNRVNKQLLCFHKNWTLKNDPQKFLHAWTAFGGHGGGFWYCQMQLGGCEDRKKVEDYTGYICIYDILIYIYICIMSNQC